MRIAIFGTGGVGGYFGGRLAQADEEVIFIARGEHLQALRSQGLQVDSIKGDFHLPSVQANDDPAAVGHVDLILVCVKAWQLAAAAEAMRPMIGPDTVVLPLLNGVEAPAQLEAALGGARVLGGLCGVMAFIADAGHIKHMAIDPFIKFGELDNRRSERIMMLHDVFAKAEGLAVEVPGDIHVAMWQKFLFIVATSGIGSVTRAPVGVYRSLPETRTMLKQAMQEVYEVALANDIALAPDIIDKTMALSDSLPEAGTASMQRDIMEGRPSELEAQTGAVVRLGQRVGVATPVNEFIYASLLAMEQRAQGQIDYEI